MAQKQLVETTASTLSKKGNRWKIVAAVPGKGSSGTYSEDVLREFGPAALAPGAKAFINHDEKRDPRDMFGFYPDGATYEEGVGLVAELEVFDHYKELIERVAPHAGMSIYMMGESDKDGNIIALHPHRTNGCDLVSFPGLEGSGITEKLYESARAASENRDEIDSSGKEMNMEKVLEELQKLTGLLSGFIAESKDAAAKQAQEAADADAAKAEADNRVEATISALESIPADLPEAVRESLVSAVKAGKTEIEPDVKAAQALVESIKQSMGSATQGYVHESASADVHDYSIARLKGA